MKQTSCLLRYHRPLPQVLSLAQSDFLFENAVKVIDADSWWLVGTQVFCQNHRARRYGKPWTETVWFPSTSLACVRATLRHQSVML